jgi:uncharacterized membrane-anchored protein YhcB (DUF1043 family)
MRTVGDAGLAVAVLGSIIGLFIWLDNRAYKRHRKKQTEIEAEAERLKKLMEKKPGLN